MIAQQERNPVPVPFIPKRFFQKAEKEKRTAG